MSVTNKLFDQLVSEKRSIEVDGLLGYFKDQQSDEYQQLAVAPQDPLDRIMRLKEYVFKCYKDRTLKDVEFFKYLAWSGQGELCKLIGYSDKQINKLQSNMPQPGTKPHLTVASNDAIEHMEIDNKGSVADSSKPILQAIPSYQQLMATGSTNMVTDGPICHEPALAMRQSPQQAKLIANPLTYIVYCKEDSENVLELSGFLHKCGINCHIDQYHTNDGVQDWGLWNEQKIKECASSDGFVLLVCSPSMYQHLCVSQASIIEMGASHISSLSLRNLITEDDTTKCIVPIFLEGCQKGLLHDSLKARSCYSVSLSLLLKINSDTDINLILDTSGLEQLRSLVYRLTNQPEVEKPRLG